MKAKKTAITVLNSLMGYLVDARYLAFNPLLLIRKKIKRSSSIEEQRVKVIERILERDEWEAVKGAIEEIPEDQRAEKERIRFLIAILFLLGIRVDELEKHYWNAFRKTGDKWWLVIVKPFQTSIISKSALPAPHTGQTQFSGTSSQSVPGAIPSSGQPSASS